MAKQNKPVLKVNKKATDMVITSASGDVVYTGKESASTAAMVTLRSRFQGPRKFESPMHLAEACSKYFEWGNMNPWKKPELIRAGLLAGATRYLEIPRPFTISEMCHFIGIAPNTWGLYRSEPQYLEFHEICQWAEEVIRDRKIQGAYVGVYHPLIASRDLGLIEKSESENTGTVKHVVTGITIVED
jgi:hypothetical protein